MGTGVDDRVIFDVWDRSGEEARAEVTDEWCPLWDEVEWECTLALGWILDTVDCLVLAVISKGGLSFWREGVVVSTGKGREASRFGRGDDVDGSLLARMGKSSSFLRGFVGPGAGHNIVHLGRVGVARARVLLVVRGEQVEDDGGELGGTSSLGEEDMVS